MLYKFETQTGVIFRLMLQSEETRLIPGILKVLAECSRARWHIPSEVDESQRKKKDACPTSSSPAMWNFVSGPLLQVCSLRVKAGT